MFAVVPMKDTVRPVYGKHCSHTLLVLLGGGGGGPRGPPTPKLDKEATKHTHLMFGVLDPGVSVTGCSI